MDGKALARTTLIQAATVALVALLVLLVLAAAEVLLVVFGGILLALLLHGVACWVHQHTGLSRRWALGLTVLVPVLALALAGWLMAPALGDQSSALVERLPHAMERLKQQLLSYDWLSRVWRGTDHLRQLMPAASSGSKYLASFFSSTLGALGNLVFAFFVGLFLAISPSLYIDGVLMLVPEARRARTREVLEATGTTLQHWLVAKLTAMAVIGVLTTVGLMLLDVDLALVLGLIAAILSFIPNFGPIISVVPAALIALIAGPERALMVLLLYAGVQTVESYMLTPLLQKRLVRMPPALLLTMQVLLGVLVGVLGVIFATPLTAAAMVMIRNWYVEDILQRRRSGERCQT